MRVFEMVDDAWKEETITELILAGGWPEVQWASFTRHQEATVGADWLWWWVDSSGACFGMLIQAKRVTWSSAGSPEIDFMYDKGRQRQALRESARILQVPAVYALYQGTPRRERMTFCPERPHPATDERCDRCHKATVSLYAASLVTVGARKPSERSRKALSRAYPLEDAANLARPLGPPTATAISGAAPSARSVGQALTDQITAALAAASPRPTAPAPAPLGTSGWITDGRVRWEDFVATTSDDDDADDFPRADSGYRHALPQEMQAAIDDPANARPDVPENVAGVVVVQLS